MELAIGRSDKVYGGGKIVVFVVLARPIAVVSTIDRGRGGAMAWSWSILFPTIERPETTPMRWAESGADEDGQVLDRGREREREREVFGAPDCGRSDYRPGSWRRDGVVLVNSLSDY